MSSQASPARATRTADACLFALRLAGWLIVSAACVAGLWTLFFAVLGSFSFSGFVFHLENLAARYVAADAGRAAEFRHTFWLASGALFLLVGSLRRHALIRAARDLRESYHGQ